MKSPAQPQKKTVCEDHSVPNHDSVCVTPEYIEGCEIYSSNTACWKCSSGYKLLSNKKCDFEVKHSGRVSHIMGCIQQTEDGSCNICAEGFNQNNGKCILGISNCASYDAQNLCIKCVDDYSLILSECRHNTLLGCKTEAFSHTCDICYFPFELNRNHCDIPDCRMLNDYGCTACECGFYLTEDRRCKTIARGCMRYERGVCNDCLPHYKLKGSICEIEGCLKYDGNYCRDCDSKY